MLCDKCGICCKLLYKANLDKEIINLLDNGEGVCKYLENNLCKIYDNRPNICNSQWMYENIYREKYALEEFNNFMHNQCIKLKEKYKDL